MPADEWLFSKDLAEKLKAAKILQQSSKDLKPVTRFKTSDKQPDQGKKPKNFSDPPRQNQYKANVYSRKGGQRQTYNYNQKSEVKIKSSFLDPMEEEEFNRVISDSIEIPQ